MSPSTRTIKKASLEKETYIGLYISITVFDIKHIDYSVDINTVQQLAGQSSTDVTSKFYVASTVEEKQNAVDQLRI